MARLFADREGLSSATLRNVMAALGVQGFWSSRTHRRAAFLRLRLSIIRGTDYAARPRDGGGAGGDGCDWRRGGLPDRRPSVFSSAGR